MSPLISIASLPHSLNGYTLLGWSVFFLYSSVLVSLFISSLFFFFFLVSFAVSLVLFFFVYEPSAGGDRKRSFDYGLRGIAVRHFVFVCLVCVCFFPRNWLHSSRFRVVSVVGLSFLSFYWQKRNQPTRKKTTQLLRPPTAFDNSINSITKTRSSGGFFIEREREREAEVATLKGHGR